VVTWNLPVVAAIPFAFPDGVDFATLIKEYATQDDHKYSPGEVIGTSKAQCCGNPDPERICTSHVERNNLTMRMQRALHFAHYNFCRIHMTLKRTPAMAAGMEDHAWTLAELIQKTSTLS